MRYHSLTIVLLLLAGCGGKDPLVSVDQFPKALIGLEEKTEKVLAAFDAGDPKAADGPMHSILRDFNLIERLAAPAGLTTDQQAALNQATGKLIDTYGTLHAPMHKPVFPADFDFKPLREQLLEGLKAVRTALPASFVAQLQDAKDKRDASRKTTTPPKAEPAPTESSDPIDGSDATAPLDDGFGEDDALLDPAADDPLGAGAALPPPAFRVAANHAGDHIAPLCPSVMLWDDASYRLAPERVNRAGQLLAGAPPDRRWVQLVPTLHARLNPDLSIDAYGTMLDRGESWTEASNFAPATDALADRFRDAFAAAIGQAVRRGMHVSILPHLDPAGGPTSEWRNLYDFAPTDRIGAGSYESLMIDPLAAAIEAEATSDTRIDLALSGEMGRSLFEHPAEYLGILKRLRQRFATNPRTAGVRIGVALDWGNLDGDRLDGDRKANDKDATADLIANCDFVGISCYSPVSDEPVAKDFASATRRFVAKLADAIGVMPSPHTRLIYSEVGIGGGYPGLGWGGSDDDSWATKDDYPVPSAVAAAPHEGRGNPRFDPWEAGELIWLRRQFHKALCDYLSGDQEPTIERAFLWSEGPWDPQGVADRRFRDDEIAAVIDAHNQRQPRGSGRP